MEVLDRLKGVAQDFAGALFSRRSSDNPNRRNPIEILKRLQREAFSDIMKLRDRQDKVERVLSFYKPSKGGSFQESSTRVRGDVDVLGALCFNDVDQQACDAIERAGITTGVHSRFTFETSIREKDTLMTEFAASVKSEDDVLHSPLSLAKVFYAANVSEWFSVVAVPVGAHCRDVGIGTKAHQGSLTTYSSWGPPLLNQHRGSAMGLMVKKSNFIASLAQFMSGFQAQPGPDGFVQCFSTFGQVVCHLSETTKLSLLGIHQMPKIYSKRVNLGGLSIPLHIPRGRTFPETPSEASSLYTIEARSEESVPMGSIALMMESELDESSRIGGWLEMQRSNPKCVQWSVSMSDTPEDEFGWGLSLGGLVQGPKRWDHFQAEAFLNLNFGRKFRLQPAIVYVIDGTAQFPTLMLRSSWSL